MGSVVGCERNEPERRNEMSKILEVGVCSDLYVAGRTEDGEQYTAEVYRVAVGFANGEVYVHRVSFPGCEVEKDEEGIQHFGDIRVQALAKAERLKARVENALASGKALDMSNWVYHRAIYGSRAYVEEVSEMTPLQLAGEID
jgi:hypothetical protein